MNDFSIQTEEGTLIVREYREDFRITISHEKNVMQLSLSLNEVILLRNNLNELLEQYVQENLA